MEDEIVKQWINSIDFKKLASECKSDLDSESLKKQNDEYFFKEMTRLSCELKEKFGIPQCSKNQFVGPVEFKEFDLTNIEDLNECEELLLSKMSFLKKYGKDLFFADYMNSMSMVMNEMKELDQKRQEVERKRRSEQYKRLKDEGE